MKQKQRSSEEVSPRRTPGSGSWVSWVSFWRMGGPLNHCLRGGQSLKRRARWSFSDTRALTLRSTKPFS